MYTTNGSVRYAAELFMACRAGGTRIVQTADSKIPAAVISGMILSGIPDSYRIAENVIR